MRHVKFNLFQYSPRYRQSWFQPIHLLIFRLTDAMIPQEADQTQIEYGFPVRKFCTWIADMITRTRLCKISNTFWNSKHISILLWIIASSSKTRCNVDHWLLIYYNYSWNSAEICRESENVGQLLLAKNTHPISSSFHQSPLLYHQLSFLVPQLAFVQAYYMCPISLCEMSKRPCLLLQIPW